MENSPKFEKVVGHVLFMAIFGVLLLVGGPGGALPWLVWSVLAIGGLGWALSGHQEKAHQQAEHAAVVVAAKQAQKQEFAEMDAEHAAKVKAWLAEQEAAKA